jgi:phosphoserine phosphatase RsbX
MRSKRKHGPSILDWAVAGQPAPGEAVSGDGHLVQYFPGGALAAAVDGVGHGAEAAAAAQVAVETLQANAHQSVLPLVTRCHEALRKTRGVVITLASFNAVDGTITWVGVGNVEGVLLRADAKASPAREHALLLGGVVGLQLPVLRGFVLPVAAGDTLILATDGIRSGFDEGLPLDLPPQQIADRIMGRYAKGIDDALVLVARYLGGAP